MIDFVSPMNSDKFTIYSKSGCPNCTKVKEIINREGYSYEVVDCDEWLIENKKEFLEFLSKLANKEIKMFPIVFDGKNYIGDYFDTKKYIEELNEYKI